MSAEDDKFERLKGFLWNCPCDFCVIYRGTRSLTGWKFKWRKAISLNRKNREGYDELAAKYQEVAEHCHRQTRNLILKENLSSASSSSQRWCGLKIPVGGIENPLPANSLGKRWWHLVVGSGAIRDAGYVVVARIAAKESSEVHDCIARIQQIWSDDLPAVPHKR